MAKRQRFKRQVGSDGQVRYFELKKDKRGIEVYTRISNKKGVKNFVSKNFDKIKNNYHDLTPQEVKSVKRSRSQRNLYRWDGKPIKKQITDLFLKTNLLNDKDPKELKNANIKNLKRFTDIEQAFKKLVSAKSSGTAFPSYGNSGHRGRSQVESIVTLREEVSAYLSAGYQLEVIDRLNAYYGVNAWKTIKNFESNETEKFAQKDLAFIKFAYPYEIDNKRKMIVINLSNVPPPFFGYSDPVSSGLDINDLKD